eukprot:TRINITY_DN12845_c0_g1_i8.p1 TRINITY_DN12845_c0_g1~~TRINITY_DN12845_c0_g1_i8.p1  ORF type:complete len:109 (-),score=8.15 TRINITY_DN12845_c0_g1_i8:398-724(-)
MNFEGFMGFCRDAKISNSLLPASKLPAIFNNVQHETAASQNELDNSDATELAFEEFLEALAAICVFRNADPYIPLHQRLHSFIVHDLVSMLATRIKGLKKIPLPTAIN